ncbi:MAG: hypothetical protein ACI91V_001072, partial [Lentimonas sp.]
MNCLWQKVNPIYLLIKAFIHSRYHLPRSRSSGAHQGRADFAHR